MRIEEILETIKKDFSEEKVSEMLDIEIPNWTDSGWQEEFEDVYEWYWDHGGGEAEEATINKMIDHWVGNYNNGEELSPEDHLRVHFRIIQEYYQLQH